MSNAPIAQVLMDQWTGQTPPPKPATPLAQATIDKTLKNKFLNDLAKGGIWVVEFTKQDGTDTVMHVTLDPAIVPPAEPLKEGKTPPPEQDHLIRAFSTDRAGWRSFTVANVQRFYQLS